MTNYRSFSVNNPILLSRRRSDYNFIVNPDPDCKNQTEEMETNETIDLTEA